MKTLPSRELLSAVLKDRFTTYVYMTERHPYLDKGDLVFANRSGCGCECAPQKINIYELMHMMKDWAFTQGYEVSSSIFSKGGHATIKWSDLYQQEKKYYIPEADTEPEAVTKACEWILKEISR